MMDHEFSNDVQCIIQKSSLLQWKEVIRVEIAVVACVAGAKREGRGGGEKHERGERKGKGAAAIRAGVFVISLAPFSELIR